MSLKAYAIIFLCCSLLQPSFQQFRINGHGNTTIRRAGGDLPLLTYNNYSYMIDEPETITTNHRQGGIYWKPIFIIVAAVMVSITIIYGRKCYYICKFCFFERTEKHYEKMTEECDV